MLWTVYVIENPNHIRYKGITEDLSRRVREHNVGLSRYTRFKGPWVLVYFETYDNKTLALKREHFIKTGKGRSFINKKITFYKSHTETK